MDKKDKKVTPNISRPPIATILGHVDHGKKTKIESITSSRPPIATILGHVDHGKTTLLDTIRKTNVAAREAGGITQHIGAYQIEYKSSEKNSVAKKITFIDTPGHQAFAKMRSRGAHIADIAILVVAANDGVMPQTVESVNHIQLAKIPCIVALNKIDLPDINTEKIKKQLVKLGLNLEEYGGETPVIPLSAKTGEGVNNLLDMILLVSELNQIKEDDPGKLKAVVIESVLSKNKGAAATVILRSGNLKTADTVVLEDQEFKVRAITDWLGKNISECLASDPVEILGWKTVPTVGSVLYKKNETEIMVKPITAIKPKESPLPVQEERIKLIIKADTAGTLEAILSALSNNPNILIINQGTGEINESDIFLAKTTQALVLGFHSKTPENVLKLAESEKVMIKTYNIIYELLDEIDDVVTAIKTGNLVNILGEAKILAVFHIKDQSIVGIKVIKNRIAKGDQVKIVRQDLEIGRAKIKSLRHGKEDITKAEQGTEAGLILSQNVDLLTGDSIISIG